MANRFIKTKTQRWLYLLTLLIAIAVIAYMAVEGLDLLSALYFVAIAITTVGFGDIYPMTQAGRIITIILIPAGIVLIFGLGFTIIQDKLSDILSKGDSDRMEQKLAKTKDHFIVCGFGRLGRRTAEALRRLGSDVVVIDSNPALKTDIVSLDCLYVIGDALEIDTLKTAGIHRCRGLITTFGDDKQNVYLVLEASDIGTDINIVSAASDRRAARRLHLAGASKVIKPHIVGGELLAKSAISPHIYQMMSDLSQDTTDNAISQIIISPKSQLADEKLSHLISCAPGIKALLVKTDTDLKLLPDDDYTIRANSVVIIAGSPDSIEQAENICAQSN